LIVDRGLAHGQLAGTKFPSCVLYVVRADMARRWTRDERELFSLIRSLSPFFPFLCACFPSEMELVELIDVIPKRLYDVIEIVSRNRATTSDKGNRIKTLIGDRNFSVSINVDQAHLSTYLRASIVVVVVVARLCADFREL
jgi:hypothetical protein